MQKLFLYQPTCGYCYNSDTIFLYQFIKNFNIKGNLLDIGCGVGILSLLLSRDFKVDTTIIDKQQKMIDYASLNFKINNLKVDIYKEDFSEFKTQKRFDFIVSNPPFYDPRVIQTKDTILNIARYAHHLPLNLFIKKVKEILAPRGWFIFCYDAKQIEEIFYLMKEYKIKVEKVRFLHSKENRDAKLVLIACRNNSKSLTTIEPPLIVFDKNSNYNIEPKNAFLEANTHSIKGDF